MPPPSSSSSNFFRILRLALLALLCIDKLRLSEGVGTEALLYPGSARKGIHLRFSDTTNWAELWKLLQKEGFFSVGKLCATGAFIIYEEPQYGVTRLNGFDIISGNTKCKVISSATKSIQPIGSASDVEAESITFFEKAHFGSPANPTAVNQGSSFFNKMEQTHSLITIGHTPWALETKDGLHFCIFPDFDPDAKHPICLVKNIPGLLGLMDSPHLELIRVSMGCKEIHEDYVYKIQDCLYFGKSPKDKPKDEKDVVESSPNKNIKGRASEGGSSLCSDEPNKKLIFGLYKAAITGTLDTDVVTQISSIGRNAWRLEMLDWIFKIITDIIDPAIIPSVFFHRTREVFIQKLAKIWGNDTLEDSDLPWPIHDYDQIIRNLESCEQMIDTFSGEDNMRLDFLKSWRAIETVDDLDGTANAEFVRRPKLDIITEMVWIAGHAVGHLCHEKYFRNTPFWALYYNLFYNLYMVPAIPDWIKGTEGLSIIFGGINLMVEYRKFAMFASIAVSGTNVELMKRPTAVMMALKASQKEEKN